MCSSLPNRQYADVDIAGEPGLTPVLDGHSTDEAEPALVVLKERRQPKGLVDQVNHGAAKAASSAATRPDRRIGVLADHGVQSETPVPSS